MKIYDILRDIFQNKTGDLNKEHSFNEAYGSNYLMQRWISMNSPADAYILNETTNKLWRGLEDDKNLWYKLFIAVTKKQKSTKINYIKKEKKTVNDTQDKIVEALTQRNELSKREIETNLDLLQLLGKDTKGYKKLLKQGA